MMSAGAALISILDSGVALIADLYQFALIDGTSLYYTSADQDIVYNGNTYVSSGPLLQRGPIRTQIGVEVDKMDLTIMVNQSLTYSNQMLATFIMQGGFDGARVIHSRAYMSTWGDTSPGVLIKFTGRVAEVSANRTQVNLSVNSDLELLNATFPKHVYQAGCVHTLFDGQCTLVKSSFAVSAKALANTTNNATVSCNLTNNAGYFTNGTVTFTSGTNNGKSYGVKSYTANTIVLNQRISVVTNDTFSAYPGCDKLSTTCNTTFNNLVNFRGYEFIPSPEAAH